MNRRTAGVLAAALAAAGGLAPATTRAEAPPAPASFVATLRLAALVTIGDDISAGIVQMKSNRAYILSVGDIDQDGLELVSVDLERGRAVVRQHGETALLSLSERQVVPLPASGTSTNAARPSIFGQELTKHLREYQQTVIRQGLPALPIPLTPEEDAQLVKDGILPPLETNRTDDAREPPRPAR